MDLGCQVGTFQMCLISLWEGGKKLGSGDKTASFFVLCCFGNFFVRKILGKEEEEIGLVNVG